MNIKFDSKVQATKHKVLKEVASRAWNDTLFDTMVDIPKAVIPGPNPTTRCCIYKERAIIAERVKMAIGGHRENPNIIEVMPIACDECPEGGYVVTDICRGCLAHKCEENCARKAISFGPDGRANIDKGKCVECGMCAKACPYVAIYNRKRPCENACKIKAISRGEDGAASINNEDCVSCGACSAQCPFGAIMDKSFILNVIDMIKKKGRGYKVHAIVAPAIASQFAPYKMNAVVSGIKALGFDDVYEVALGADMVALKESKELAENGGPMTSSCCPAFVAYIKHAFPAVADKISHNDSPMVELAKYIKASDPTSKVIFVGPCTAKKREATLPHAKEFIDSVITFEELYALFESKDIDLAKVPEEALNDATYYGRIFARSGGLSEAVVQALKEQEIDFEVKPVIAQGLDQCKLQLTKLNRGAMDGNFLEGMACTFGCVGGAGCITRNERSGLKIDAHGKTSSVASIKDAVEGAK